MPTPWLSWPARLAATRWVATRSASSVALPPALTMVLVTRRRRSAVARMLLDLAQAKHLRPAVHELAHLAAQGLEVLGGAVRFHRGLIDVALHEDVGARRLAVVQRVELAARLAGVNLGDQLLGDGLELFFLALLHLQRGDDS